MSVTTTPGRGGVVTVAGAATGTAVSQTGILPRTGGDLLLVVSIAAFGAILASMLVTKLQKR